MAPYPTFLPFGNGITPEAAQTLYGVIGSLLFLAFWVSLMLQFWRNCQKNNSDE